MHASALGIGGRANWDHTSAPNTAAKIEFELTDPALFIYIVEDAGFGTIEPTTFTAAGGSRCPLLLHL